MDIKIDGRWPTDDEAQRLASILAEKGINLNRPIRHWTIDHVRALRGDCPDPAIQNPKSKIQNLKSKMSLT